MTTERARSARTVPHLKFESHLWSSGLQYVAGLDEAGRGAWAGPVYAAAVILPIDNTLGHHLSGVRDSKQMTARQRFIWAEKIKAFALAWGVGHASQNEIDALGILPATRLAMMRSLEQLSICPNYLLLDFVTLPDVELPQTALVKGDAQSLSIAAASVLAKTGRDTFMQELDGQYPNYGLGKHKGYGTAFHRQALLKNGLTPIHRCTFKPMKDLIT